MVYFSNEEEREKGRFIAIISCYKWYYMRMCSAPQFRFFTRYFLVCTDANLYYFAFETKRFIQLLMYLLLNKINTFLIHIIVHFVLIQNEPKNQVQTRKLLRIVRYEIPCLMLRIASPFLHSLFLSLHRY